MWKLLCFFMKRHRALIEPKVSKYLLSKKLSLDDWITSVKNNRRGDIVCVYLLSMVTGNHTAIHLKNNRVWSTLKTVPLLPYELVDRCNIHLVYMGFGIFLELKKRPTPMTTRILGTITRDDPDVRANLYLLIKTEKPETSQVPNKSATSVAGSMSQLRHMA